MPLREGERSLRTKVAIKRELLAAAKAIRSAAKAIHSVEGDMLGAVYSQRVGMELAAVILEQRAERVVSCP